MRKVNHELAELQSRFLEYYKQNLGHKFAGLEDMRKENLFFFWKWLVIFVLIAGFWISLNSFGVLSAEIYDDKNWGCYAVGLYLVVVFEVLNRPVADFKIKTKVMTMGRILDFFGNFKYQAGKCTRACDVEKCKLFGPFDKQHGDDFFCGRYKNVQIQVSEERLTKRVRTKNGYRDATIFGGIIIILEMNKNFSGQTIVRKDWGIFNFLMIAPRCSVQQQEIKMANVKLEDCVFEKKFEVFSTDQVEARYLLTTAFMERILEVKKRFHGKKIQLSFFDNKLLIAVDTSKDMFETTSLFGTTARYGRMRDVVGQFHSIFSVIDLLKLNQKTNL